MAERSAHFPRQRLILFQCSQLCDKIIFEVFMLLEGSSGCDCSAELKRKESERIQERIESLENLENDLKYKLDYES